MPLVRMRYSYRHSFCFGILSNQMRIQSDIQYKTVRPIIPLVDECESARDSLFVYPASKPYP